MAKIKSERNRTIDFSVEEGKDFLIRCIDSSTETHFLDITNKTILGNTFAVMEKLPHEFVDLAIVDPPYNLAKNYSGNKFNKTSQENYFGYTKEWILKLLLLLKKTATFYICCDWKSSIVIADVLSLLENENKLHIQNRISWQREKGRGAKQNWKNSMEDIWFCTVSENYVFNLDAVKVRRKVLAPYKIDGKPKDWINNKNEKYRDTCPGNFWDDISIPFWSMPENTAHPTQKPEKLIAKLILASSNSGDFVFDPFLGSGTTSVVAKKLNRRYLGIEQSPQYCCWAEKRLEDANTNTNIQGFSGGIFWERNSFPY